MEYLKNIKDYCDGIDDMVKTLIIFFSTDLILGISLLTNSYLLISILIVVFLIYKGYKKWQELT